MTVTLIILIIILVLQEYTRPKSVDCRSPIGEPHIDEVSRWTRQSWLDSKTPERAFRCVPCGAHGFGHECEYCGMKN